MTAVNTELNFTLDEAVAEVLGMLTGLDLTYEPEVDRYRAITRQLNRALRANATEREWSWYADTVSIGQAIEGDTVMEIPVDRRPRIINDDAVRLVDEDNRIRVWAYFLPRDALHKYGDRGPGLWASVLRSTLVFSRPFSEAEAAWDVQLPVMREPTMFRLPAQPEGADEEVVEVDPEIREQPIDFAYPDAITARAAYFYAQTDPVMQPRVQTLEGVYKDIMYQLIERDERMTDSPYSNEFIVPLHGAPNGYDHGHPHAAGWGH